MPAVMPRKHSAPSFSGSSAAAPSTARSSPAGAPVGQAGGARPEAEILFQNYFKSIGPRTYAAQIKRAGNGNHFLVITEGKRDDKTDDIRKTRLFVFSEDFAAFFRMLHETAKFIRENPVPDDVRQKRQKFWARQNGSPKPRGNSAPPRAEFSPRDGRRAQPRSNSYQRTQRTQR